MRAGVHYLGHPFAAYDLDPEAQAHLLGAMWAEQKVANRKPEAAAPTGGDPEVMAALARMRG